MLAFPAAGLLRFLDNHGLLDLWDRPRWRTVAGGSRRYVERILDALGPGQVRLNSPVRHLLRSDQGVQVTTGAARMESFDHAVVATHADAALGLLADADPAERRLLGTFRFQRNRVVLHTDPALMPRRRGVWSSWNYVADRLEPDNQRVSVTYWMNRLQGLAGPEQYFVTLNPLHEPDPARVVREIAYEHPLLDRAAAAAQEGLGEIQGRRRTWFCGAWCGSGFHEDGLASAERVARGLGVAPPWEAAGRD